MKNPGIALQRNPGVPYTALEARQAAELETVYRTAPIGLALFDPVEFRYLRANDRQAEFFGCSVAQLIGKTVTEMAPIPGLRELFEQVAAGTPVVNYPLEGELVGRPGEYRYWLVNYHPVYGPDGSVQAISAASLEVTEQKRAEKFIAQNERMAMIGRLTSSIAHEINNPINAVTNFLYLIQSDLQLSAESRTYAQAAEKELVRVAEIVTQSLRFQRRTDLRQAVDCRLLVDSVLQLFEHKIRNSGLTISVEHRTTRMAHCVENEIKQVLTNLLENAIHATQRAGRLRLRLSDASMPKTQVPGIRISVGDTGLGMSPETLAHILDPFFTTKGMDGSGLGLWISAEIVKKHDGVLLVRSSQKVPRCGTVFCVLLPVAEA